MFKSQWDHHSLLARAKNGLLGGYRETHNKFSHPQKNLCSIRQKCRFERVISTVGTPKNQCITQFSDFPKSCITSQVIPEIPVGNYVVIPTAFSRSQVPSAGRVCDTCGSSELPGCQHGLQTVERTRKEGTRMYHRRHQFRPSGTVASQ